MSSARIQYDGSDSRKQETRFGSSTCQALSSNFLGNNHHDISYQLSSQEIADRTFQLKYL